MSNALSLLSLNDFLVTFFSQERLSATECTQQLRHKMGNRKHIYNIFEPGTHMYYIQFSNITYDTDLGLLKVSLCFCC